MIFSTFKPNGHPVEVSFFSIIDDENRNSGLQLIKQLQHDGNDNLKFQNSPLLNSQRYVGPQSYRRWW